ncbi:LCP family protein [uncultured Bifidobacterium sp.]|uniref:LCP family protein n=1 Tax=uncultured Bifidobacterium sp. TaxID=165187 RepID=UPI0025F6B538|nr:LCP family protein [uncultured Bifidobacterium sp.]
MRTGSSQGGQEQEPPSFMPSRPRRLETAPSAPAASARHSRRQQEPPSFSPSSWTNTPRTVRRTSGSSRTTPRPAAQAAPSGNSWGNGGGRGNRGMRSSTALAHKHPVRKFVGTLLLVILLALVLLAGGGWFWINARLNREQMLTDAPGSGATTWLLLGSDQRDGSPGAGQDTSITGFRTDTILVLTKPRHGAASLISVPRDSLAKDDGRYMKINAVAYTSGYRSLTSQIEGITGHKVDHVALIRFGGLSKVVDAMGGVNLCYDADVNDPRSGMVWSKGCHQADGGMALAFTRMRYSDPRGDFGRAERQRQAISAITSKALQPAVLLNPVTAGKVLSAGLDSLVVDEQANAIDLVRMILAFRSASGPKGVTGSLYWTNPNYFPNRRVGSTVLLDQARNTELFDQLVQGSHDPGTVGGN